MPHAKEFESTDAGTLGWPVVRIGVVCPPIKGLTFDIAQEIREELARGWAKYVFARLKTHAAAFGWSKIETRRGQKCLAEYRDGAAVIYPEIRLSLDEISGTARGSTTVCAYPRHSKVWFRVSCFPQPNIAPATLLGVTKVGHVTDVADEVCHQSVEPFLTDYTRVLEQWKLMTPEPTAHTIRIKTAAANLGDMADLLRSQTFKMADFLRTGGLKRVEALGALLHLTYGQSVLSYDDYARMPKETRWVAVSVGEQEKNLVGLYSMQHRNGCTDYLGLVHEDSPRLDVLSESARVLGRKLLQNIAPKI